MNKQRHVQLLRNGRNQVVCIPHDMKMEGNEVILRGEGNRLIIESVSQTPLGDLLRTLKPIDEPYPDVDADLPPLDDVRL